MDNRDWRGVFWPSSPTPWMNVNINSHNSVSNREGNAEPGTIMVIRFGEWTDTLWTQWRTGPAFSGGCPFNYENGHWWWIISCMSWVWWLSSHWDVLDWDGSRSTTRPHCSFCPWCCKQDLGRNFNAFAIISEFIMHEGMFIWSVQQQCWGWLN